MSRNNLAAGLGILPEIYEGEPLNDSAKAEYKRIEGDIKRGKNVTIDEANWLKIARQELSKQSSANAASVSSNSVNINLGSNGDIKAADPETARLHIMANYMKDIAKNHTDAAQNIMDSLIRRLNELEKNAIASASTIEKAYKGAAESGARLLEIQTDLIKSQYKFQWEREKYTQEEREKYLSKLKELAENAKDEKELSFWREVYEDAIRPHIPKVGKAAADAIGELAPVAARGVAGLLKKE